MRFFYEFLKIRSTGGALHASLFEFLSTLSKLLFYVMFLSVSQLFQLILLVDFCSIVILSMRV